MAISAKQFEVVGIGCPIFKPSTHYIDSVLWALFFRRINMVNIKASEIGDTASYAFAPEIFNDFHFTQPFPFSVRWAAVFVPIILLAFWSTKTRLAWLPASFTVSRIRPTMSEITFLAAIFPCPALKAVGMHQNSFTAMRADNFRWLISHIRNISKYINKRKPKYFDIACRRIADAYKQPRLFEDEKPQPKPQELIWNE